ncbi:MAG: DUF11 domain-containing protein [Lachnospiraceae bacterium]|nr:DUF11 domain-containing protein [Lachnospiraceae bacterium]
MATFYNQATLSYNGNTTTSNITTGELVEVLSAKKRAVLPDYVAGDAVTYIVTIVNSGNVPFTDLTLTDDLGAYTSTSRTLVPLTYVDGSVKYYINGILQAPPTLTAAGNLTITGITVPANGNAAIVYQTAVNQFAPLSSGSSITNTAKISGAGLTNDLVATEQITAADTAMLTISKSVSPTTVSENGQLTYTFVIQNNGNTPATAADNVVVTDTFNPILDPITVTFNGTVLTEPTNYTYDKTTGQFTSVAGQITVPAATYTRDATTESLIINPGVSILTISGTV